MNDIKSWAKNRNTSFTIDDLEREFDRDTEVLWDMLEELDVTSYRDVANPRSPCAIEEGVVRSRGVRYNVN